MRPVTGTTGLMTANGNWGGYLFSHPFDNDNTDAPLPYEPCGRRCHVGP
ncbi:protein of unknown function [Burkholderia multivorans]